MKTVYVLARRADDSIDLSEEIVAVFSDWGDADDYLEKEFKERVDDGSIEPEEGEDADDYFYIHAVEFDPAPVGLR